MNRFLLLPLIIFVSCNESIGTKNSLIESNSKSISSALTIISLSGVYQLSSGDTLSSCYDYLQSSAYSSHGSGYYLVDIDGSGGVDPISVYCNMELDSGGWTRVFFHDTAQGVFTAKADATLADSTDPSSSMYSILNYIDSFRSTSDFEFYMRWPSNGPCELTPHHWTQSSNPTTTSEAVSGYVNISGGSTSSSGSKGLCLSSRPNTLLDGNCGHSSWWYAVGQTSLFSGGIPACRSGETIVELYVR